jgi:hypothetical protein
VTAAVSEREVSERCDVKVRDAAEMATGAELLQFISHQENATWMAVRSPKKTVPVAFQIAIFTFDGGCFQIVALFRFRN